MKRVFSGVMAGCFCSIAFIISSCTENGGVGPVSSENVTVPVITKEVAMQIASDELANMRSSGDDCGWSSGAKVVDAFEIFQGTLDNKAYFECKVSDGGKDAGYVLVTANKTDLLIPESCPTGKTLTEQYRENLGTDDIRVIRFDWFMSAAVNGNGDILDAKGFFSNENGGMSLKKMAADEVASTIQKWQESYAGGVFPLYSAEMLDDYYRECESPRGLAKDEWRDIYSSLSNTFADGNHTPRWYQKPYNSNLAPVGCGPTAWAILYGYWAEFKGKGALFDYPITNRTDWIHTGDPDIWYCMTRTSLKMGNLNDMNEEWSITFPWNMPDGIKYAEERGFSGSVTRDRGTEYSKFDKINGYISNDKPCMLAIGDNSAVANHYVVVEKCKKSQYKYAFIWHDRNVYYFSNYGGGVNSKWICVRDWGKNQNPVTSAFSAYMVNLNSSTTKTGVSLRTCNGYYFCAENGGGGSVVANRTSVGQWETFSIIDLNGGNLENGNVINIRSSTGHYLRAINGGGSDIDAQSFTPYAWESFKILKASSGDAIIRSGDKVRLYSFSHPQYLCAENGGGGVINVNRNAASDWETFTIKGNL
jgi:hypothetical protein